MNNEYAVRAIRETEQCESDFINAFYRDQMIPFYENSYLLNMAIAINNISENHQFSRILLEYNNLIGKKLSDLYLVTSIKNMDPVMFDLSQQLSGNSKPTQVTIPSFMKIRTESGSMCEITVNMKYMIDESDYHNIESTRKNAGAEK